MLNRTIARYLFYGVVITLFAWTASLTVSFLQSVLPNSFWAVPYLGLVIFDGGLIAWMFVFLSHAEGAIQRSTALILTVFNMLGVGLMVIAEILLDGQSLTAAPESLGTVAVWAVGIWTIANVAGVVLFHLGDNNARREMAMQSERDAVFDAALKNLSQQRASIQEELARQLGTAMLDDLVREVRSDANRDGTPDILQRGAQSGKHNAPRHEPVQPPAAVGQGGSANGRGPGGNSGANFQ